MEKKDYDDDFKGGDVVVEAVDGVPSLEDGSAVYDPHGDRVLNKGLQRGLKPRHVSVGSDSPWF